MKIVKLTRKWRRHLLLLMFFMLRYVRFCIFKVDFVYRTRMLLVCTCMLLVCTRMLLVCPRQVFRKYSCGVLVTVLNERGATASVKACMQRTKIKLPWWSTQEVGKTLDYVSFSTTLIPCSDQQDLTVSRLSGPEEYGRFVAHEDKHFWAGSTTSTTTTTTTATSTLE